MTWKRVLAWMAAGVAVLLLALVVAGYFVLRSDRFHQYVIAMVERKAADATGGRVEVGAYWVRLSPITLTIDRVVVRGTEPSGALPLLQADQLKLGVKIVSLFKRKIDLRDIEVAHPVVDLIVDKAGKTNIPSPKNPAQSNGSTNIWDLGIQHVLLTNGEIYYNARKTPLEAELHDLNTRVDYDSANQRYAGSMSYDRGRLRMGSYRPLAHNLQAHFNASSTHAELQSLTLSLGSSRATLRGTVNNYNQPVVAGEYRVLLHTADFRAALGNDSLPIGDLEVSGSLQYHDLPGRPLLETASMRGQLFSRALDVLTPQVRTRVNGLRAEYSLAGNDFNVRRLQAELLGGRVDADLTVRNVSEARDAQLRASLTGISVSQAKAALRKASSNVPVTGTLNADTRARWHGTLQGLMAELDGTIAGQTAGAAARSGAVPLNGIFHASYDGARSLLTVRQTQIRTPDSLLTVNGTVGDRSNLQIQANTSNLHSLVQLASSLQSPTPGKPAAAPPNIGGEASASALVQGSLKRPQITGQLSARNLQLENTTWKTLQVGLAASPSRIELHDGNLVSAVKGNMHFGAAVGLRNWQYRPTSPLTVNLTINQIPARLLARAARLTTPVGGDVSARVNLHGTQQSPFGNGWVQVVKATVMNVPVSQASLRFQGNGEAVSSTLQVSTPAGDGTTNLVFHPKSQGYDVRLQAPRITLEKIPRAREMQVAGVLSVSGQGRGTLKDPQLDLIATIPQLSVRRKPVSNVNLRLNVANQRADITLNSAVAQSFLRARGTVALTGDKQSSLQLDTGGIGLGVLLATYAPGQASSKLNGTLELHANASGPLSKPDLMQAHVEIPTLALDYQGYHVGSSGPVRADYRAGVVTLQRTQLRGTDTILNLEGSLPVKSSAPANFTADGSVDLRIAQMFTPGITSSGRIEIAVHGAGPTSAPGIQGQIRIVNAAFASASAPIGVDNLNSTLAVSNTRVAIESFTAHSGGGTLSASGFVDYRPTLAMNIALTGHGIRVLYPEGVRSVMSSNLQLVGNPQASSLTGRVVLNSLSFTPGFDVSSLLGSMSGGGGVSAAPPSALEQNMKLGVALQSAGEFQATSSQVSLAGSLNLQLTGTAANPVIVGRADLTSGEMFFMNRRYEIQRATATFSDPNRTVPDLNVLVTTVINQYNVTISLLGTPDRLQTNYVSDPPLPPVDVINLIARGQTTEQQAASPGNLGANQVIASALASQVGGNLQKLTGVSSLQIDPTIGGNNSNPSARLAIQQRVTKNFFFTFSTDVTSTQDEVVQLEYQFNNRWSASAVRDQNGNMGLDAKYHTKF
jgi:translocation and assembly module TamB